MPTRRIERLAMIPECIDLRRYCARMVFAFGLATFVASAILFLIQPMVAKMMLPLFGGSSSVWLASMVFFQAVLLGGYAYANWSIRRFGPRRQSLVHIALLILPVPLLPLALPEWQVPPGGGSLWVLLILSWAVGVPFFVVSTSSPLLQRWFGALGHSRSSNPYFLYAIGNTGSLLGLLAYPLLVEAKLTIQQQATTWAVGYLALLVAALTCIWFVRRFAGNEASTTLNAWGELEPISSTRKLKWIVYTFIPSSLLLAATNFISAEVGAIPLLWVIPLAVYLVTFIVAFGRRSARRSAQASRYLALAALLVFITWATRAQDPLWLLIIIHSAFLLFAGIVAHSRLYESRPDPSQLTSFYLYLSIGGVLGGAFTALVVPFVFDSALDYPMMFVVALLLRRSSIDVSGSLLRRFAPALIAPLVALAATNLTGGQELWFVMGALALSAVILLAADDYRAFAVGMGLMLIAVPPLDSNAIWSERNFYGMIRVQETSNQHILYHGRTVHGVQNLDGETLDLTLYYNPTGPLGDVFAAAQTPDSVGVIGLGAGTLAAYVDDGQSMTFFEIDPAMETVARNRALFSFIADSKATIKIRVGDGRRLVADVPPNSFDLLILDAFSADAIPVHLLTREAFEEYRSKLTPGALIAIHISNRYFDLEPVLALQADYLGLAGLLKRGSGSTWVVIGDTHAVHDLETSYGWSPLVKQPGLRIWTDEYSYELAVLR